MCYPLPGLVEEEVSDLKESDMTGYYGFADHHKLEAEIQEMDNEGGGQTDGYCLTMETLAKKEVMAGLESHWESAIVLYLNFSH